MKRPHIPPRALWLAAMVAGFLLLTASLALQWWPGAWAALFIGLTFSVAFWRLHSDVERERHRWQRMLDAMQSAVVVWDHDDRLLYANADFRRVYGLTEADLPTGISFEALLRHRVRAGAIPQARGREEAWIAERLDRHRAAEDHAMLRQMADGRWRRIVEQRLADGRLLSYSIDVTELIEREQDLAQARAEAERGHQMLRDAIEAMPAGIEIYDEADRLVIYNQRLAQLYSHVASEMAKGRTFETIVRRSLQLGMLPQARGREEAWLAERLARRGRSHAPLLQLLSDGRWLQVHETRSASGAIVGVRLDVTELIQAREAAEAARAHAQAAALALRDVNAELETLSTTDALTGVANRRRFDQRLHEELQRVRRYDAPLTLLLIDIDFFKRYNDRHGHPQGDRALQAVAQVLAQQARRPGELVARYGGEEFAILLPHADLEVGRAVAERCQTGMAQLALPHGSSSVAPHVTLSIGVAQWLGPDRENASALLRRADEALYAAKAAGRARSVVATRSSP